MPSQADAQTGTFTDRDGDQHPWHITDANVLIWDDKPYVPFGGMFVSRYLRLQKESAFNEDYKVLKMVREQGITDLYLNTMPKRDPKIMQRVIDQFESLGFNYGIQIPMKNTEDIQGYRIDPTKYSLAFTAPGTAQIELEKPGKKKKPYRIESTRYIVVRAKDGALITAGIAPVIDGKCSISLNDIKGDVIIKCSPKATQNNWVAPHATKMTAWLKQLTFGKGFRFLIEPITNEYHFANHFLPASQAWQQWTANFFKARYTSIDKLAAAWGIDTQDVTSFQQAVRLVPMITGPKDSTWANRGYVIDPQNDKPIAVDMTVCRMWLDLCEARDLMMNERLNTICNELRQTLNVPIVAKRHYESTRLWTNSKTTGGIDGLGMESYGTGEELAYFNGTATYADIAQSKRNVWCLVTEYNPAHWHNKHIVYKTRKQMYRDLNLLMSQGAKGIFFFGLQLRASGGDNQWTIFELCNDPKQMRWLADFVEAARSNPAWLNKTPDMAFIYPMQNTDSDTFLRSDMPVYGVSGNWSGKTALVKLADGKWAAPVFDPTGLKHVIVQKNVLNHPVLTHEKQVLAQSGVQPTEANWNQSHATTVDFVDQLTDGFKTIIDVQDHAIMPGVEAVTWNDKQHGPMVRLYATGPSVVLELKGKQGSVQINESLRPSWQTIDLPATMILPYTQTQEKSFMLHNAGFGIKKAVHFTVPVGEPSGFVTLRNVQLSNLSIQRAQPVAAATEE